jgi:hypothetical protein
MDHEGVVAFRLGITTVSLVREMSFAFQHSTPAH